MATHGFVGNLVQHGANEVAGVYVEGLIHPARCTAGSLRSTYFASGGSAGFGIVGFGVAIDDPFLVST